MKRLAALLASLISAAAIAAEPVRILFVGNSFTHTRPPALQYNVDNVVDMNLQNSIDKPGGADPPTGTCATPSRSRTCTPAAPRTTAPALTVSRSRR